MPTLLDTVVPASMPGSTTHALLRLVRATQPISRAELSRRLHVNRSTVTEIVRPLLSVGILREGAPEQSTSGRIGRPPIGVSLRDEGLLLVGVNIGVRQTHVGGAGADGEVLIEETFDTPTGVTAAMIMARDAIERVRERVPERQLALIGVSVPGPTDATRTRLLYAPHLGGDGKAGGSNEWRNVAIADQLQIKTRPRRAASSSSSPEARDKRKQATGFVPVIVENDATAAAMYEASRRLRDATNGTWKDFILVRAGTGIGVGLVLNGEVYRGTGPGGGFAGEFGHMTIAAGGKQCACGNRGCWERYASASAAASLYTGDRLQGRDNSAPRFSEIVQRAEAGERRAQATLGQIGDYLGIGIGNVMGGFGVPRVVVSGRIVLGWRFIRDSLHNAVARSMAGRLPNWAVEAGTPRGAGLGGALEVAIEQYLTTLHGVTI